MNAVVVVEHDPTWPQRFREEALVVGEGLGPACVAVQHIGSTSIPGILAKPIIDMLAEVSEIDAADRRTAEMAALGYEAKGEYGIQGRRYFRKSSPAGTRAFHLHVFEEGSSHSQRMLAFRDYLRAHPEAARRYSDLKGQLVSRSIDRARYVDGKDRLVKELEREALNWVQTQTDTE